MAEKPSYDELLARAQRNHLMMHPRHKPFTFAAAIDLMEGSVYQHPTLEERREVTDITVRDDGVDVYFRLYRRHQVHHDLYVWTAQDGSVASAEEFEKWLRGDGHKVNGVKVRG